MKIISQNLFVSWALAAALMLFEAERAKPASVFRDANWISLGGIPGADSVVQALAEDESGNLYAGGYFSVVGDAIARGVAKWNGTNWSALGSGMNQSVFALAVSGSDLYAGGDFTTAGGHEANYVAKWNGTNWSALGAGMDRRVLALTVWRGELYAGGNFEKADGQRAYFIAKWDGRNWSQLSVGTTHAVHALAAHNDLYAGGRFDIAYGGAARHIAKWSPPLPALGSGLNNDVYALAVSGADLYAGGTFTTAGGKVSAYVARARIGSTARSLIATNSIISVVFSGVVGCQYDVQRTTRLDSSIPWTTLTTSPLSPAPDGSFTFDDTSAPPGTAYYRAVQH